MSNYYKIEANINPETGQPFFEGSATIKSDKDLSLPENEGLIPVLASVELHRLGIKISHQLLEDSTTYRLELTEPPKETDKINQEAEEEDDGFAPGVWGELGYRNRR